MDFSLLTPEQLDELLSGPAMESPDGEYNLENPSNQTGMTIGLMGLCMFVVVLCLSIRGYARLLLVKKVETQEYLLLAAFIGFIGWAVCTMQISQVMGYFVHQWDMTFYQLADAGMWIHISSNLYTAILPLLKISILVEWLGMFAPRGTRGWFFWACWFMIVVQIGFAISAFVVLNISCSPTRKKWQFWIDGKCLDNDAIEVASAAFQLASDFIILLLPQHLIWTLHMSWKKRAGVSVIFSLGAFACIAAGFRLASSIIYIDTEDLAYQVGPVALWAYAEMTCGFIVVCIPCVPRIMLESGAWRKFKKNVGMPVTTGITGLSGPNTTKRSAHSTVRSKQMRSANDSYLELDDHEMKTMGTESTEHLRDEDLKYGKHGNSIVRTTRVTVTQGSDAPMEVQGAQEQQRYNPNGQWRS